MGKYNIGRPKIAYTHVGRPGLTGIKDNICNLFKVHSYSILISILYTSFDNAAQLTRHKIFPNETVVIKYDHIKIQVPPPSPCPMPIYQEKLSKLFLEQM